MEADAVSPRPYPKSFASRAVTKVIGSALAGAGGVTCWAARIVARVSSTGARACPTARPRAAARSRGRSLPAVVGQGVGARLADGGEDFGGDPVLEGEGLGFVRAHDELVEAVSGGLVEGGEERGRVQNTSLLDQPQLVWQEQPSAHPVGGGAGGQSQSPTDIGRYEPRVAVESDTADLDGVVRASGETKLTSCQHSPLGVVERQVWTRHPQTG